MINKGGVNMWYLLFYPDDIRRMCLGVLYMAFLDYESAEKYAKIRGINAIITDDITPFF